jgi:hypothetical protein
MANLGPWLVVAGLGALHGLNPATGWMLAAARSVRSGDRSQAWRALLPIGVGHLASIALVAAAVPLGLSMHRGVLPGLAAVLLAVVALAHRSRRASQWASAPIAPAGLAVGSFMMSTAHGTGLMLVPALIPICIADAPARAITASGSLGLALAAVGVHTAAMLAVVGAVAVGACRGIDGVRGWVRRRDHRS